MAITAIAAILVVILPAVFESHSLKGNSKELQASIKRGTFVHDKKVKERNL